MYRHLIGLVVISLFCCLHSAITFEIDETLKGLTVLRAPFVERDLVDGTLKGYFVDLLDELSRVGNFNYTLTELPTSVPNGRNENNPTALTNELYRRRADFAIADYMVRQAQSTRNVDYSEPYLVSSMSALVDKKRLANANVGSIEDLINQRKTQPQTTTTDDGNEPIILGAARSSSTYRHLTMTNDPIGRQLYEWLFRHSTQMVDSREEGITRVLKSPYAFVQESMNNDLATDEHCELTQLQLSNTEPISPHHGMKLEYSIAVASEKARKYLPAINQAMEELKTNGKLDELHRRYWNRKCNGSPSDRVQHVVTAICTLFSLSISLFLLS
ncbi:hypothetical protein RDWZM_001382 [Blomia tropicalis]|uniref:Ionotropic glutamate receptor C-terminal domain-containing protein n=1 Tax=Blomia tropicalis TaxID=40697 RepID=A0A9Q0ME63_BLOTA|nr:hypothetical protein BLOT_007434 [Blomia tropicalis]KAJ6222837.1 hypothetical protein RDWZM_001382 [Blomia tropicalis]